MYQVIKKDNIFNIYLKSIEGEYNFLSSKVINGLTKELNQFVESEFIALIIHIDESSLKYNQQNQIDSINDLIDFQKALLNIEMCDRPVISLISNDVVGIGIELILASDYVVNLNHSITYHKLNDILPFAGAIQRLSRLIGFDQATKFFYNELSLTDEHFKQSHITFENVEEIDHAYKTIEIFNHTFRKNEFKFKSNPKIQSPKGYQFFPVMCAHLVSQKKDQILNYKLLLDSIYQGGQVDFERALEIDLELFLQSINY